MPFPFASPLPPSIVLAHDVVEVPVVRGDGDPRPRVQAQLDEDEAPILAIVDLGGSHVRIGSLLAARNGIAIRGTAHRTALLPWLRVGDLVVNSVEADVVSGNELYLAAGALTGLATQVSASDGVVRFSRETEALLDAVGEGLPLDGAQQARWRERGTLREGSVHGAVQAELQAEGSVWNVLLRVRSDRAVTTLSSPLAGLPEVRRARRPGAEVGLLLGEIALPVRFRPWDESLADPRPSFQGELGADVLAGLDIAVDPTRGRIAFAQVLQPRWADADSLRLERLEGWAATAEKPVAGTEDVLARVRWAELASLRWEVGDVAWALEADQVLASIAGDRCDLWQAMGERALRAGHDATEAFALAEAPLLAWQAAGREQRARVREGRQQEPEEPPSACIGAPVPLPRGEGPLRAALAEGRGGPAVGAALARLLYDEGRVAPALAAVRTGWPLDAHALTTALVLGPALLGGASGPPEVAASLVLLAHGAPEPPWLADRVDELRVTRPGDPSVLCQVALYDALLGPAEIPTMPEADCLAAGALVAVHQERWQDVADISEQMQHQWPDLVSDDPLRLPVRMLGQSLEAR